MNGLITNPFSEGIICIMLGIGCYVLAKQFAIPDLSLLGGGLGVLGTGYMGGHVVANANKPS